MQNPKIGETDETWEGFAEKPNMADFPSGGQGIQEAFRILLEMAKTKHPDFEGDISELPLDRPVRIAILDTGVDLNHKAFAGQNIKVTDEQRVKNFVVDKDGNASKERKKDVFIDHIGHGTFCAGIAVGNFTDCIQRRKGGHRSAKLYTGVAPFAKLLIGKVLQEIRQGNEEKWLSEGIDWSVKQGADIISVSMGHTKFSSVISNSVYLALEKDVIVVCCASNFGRRDSSTIVFPAKMGNVVCVGSHGSHMDPSKFSGVGREIDFLAPGDDVWSALASSCDTQETSNKSARPGITGGVGPDKGTSLSTPYIAGLCALILAFAEFTGGPNLRQKVSNCMVIKILLQSMSSQPGVHDQIIGYGSVDPSRIFKFSSQYFQQIVDDILSIKLSENEEYVEIGGRYVPVDDNILQIDFRKPIEFLLRLYHHLVPGFHDQAKRLELQYCAIVGRWFFKKFKWPWEYGPVVIGGLPDWSVCCNVTVADLRYSDKDTFTELGFPEGVLFGFNLWYLLSDIFYCCKSLQLIMLSEIPTAKESNLCPRKQSDRPFFVYVDTVKLSELQLKDCPIDKILNICQTHTFLIAKRLIVDTPNRCEYAKIESHQCMYVENVDVAETVNGDSKDVEMPTLERSFAEILTLEEEGCRSRINVLDILNGKPGGSGRRVFRELDEMPSEIRNSFDQFRSDRTNVFSLKEEIFVKMESHYVNYLKLSFDALQLAFSSSVHSVLDQIDHQPQVKIINLDVPPSFLYSEWNLVKTPGQISYAFDKKRRKRLDLCPILEEIRSRFPVAELDVVHLPSTFVKDVRQILSCSILQKCRVIDLGEDVDLFELIMWANVAGECIQTQVTLRCAQVNVTNSVSLLDPVYQGIEHLPGNITLEIHKVRFNCDCPSWTTLSSNILDTVIACIARFSGVVECYCSFYDDIPRIGTCCTKQIITERISALKSAWGGHQDETHPKTVVKCSCSGTIVSETELPQHSSLATSPMMNPFVKVESPSPARMIAGKHVTIATVHAGIETQFLAMHAAECFMDYEESAITGSSDNGGSDSSVDQSENDRSNNNFSTNEQAAGHALDGCIYTDSTECGEERRSTNNSAIKSNNRVRGNGSACGVRSSSGSNGDSKSNTRNWWSDLSAVSLNQFLLSTGKDNEVYYGSRISCRAVSHVSISVKHNIEHYVHVLSRTYNWKVLHLSIANPMCMLESNRLADSLDGMLRHEDEGRLQEVDIVVIPFGFKSYNHRLFTAISNVSRRGKIVVAAALKKTVSPSSNLCEISFPGHYGDVLTIGSHDEKGNATGRTPRGRELDFLMPSSGPEEACFLAADFIARILNFADQIGGERLRRAVRHNSVMRELLRRHCSARVGQHDFVNGYGELRTNAIFRFSPVDFKRAVADITNDYTPEQ